MERIPPSERTREQLKALMKGRRDLRQRVRASRADVRVGSKCEKLNVSKSSPLCPIERTSMGHAGTSLMGQSPTSWTSRQSASGTAV
jgi:hypothetical protein